MKYAYILLILLVACGSSASTTSQATTPATEADKSTVPTKFTTVKVKASYPHSVDAYTQGLLWHEGKLYESTGEYGHSSLRRVDLTSGKVEKIKKLGNQFFGEGLALCDGKLIQLTWQEGKAFVYDLNTFKQVSTNDIQGEGWGITHNDGELYVSDGSNVISVLDPSTFRVKRKIEVRHDQGDLNMINELEWIDGKIWANVYTSPLIAVIDPKSGIVERFIDCSSLVKQIENPQADVLNGIAYDTLANRVFVTGKRWDKLFEIEK